jgi:hypothetical protein
MTARSNRSNQRPDTLMQDRYTDRSRKFSCDARPDHTSGHFEPPRFETVAAELAWTADAGGAMRPPTVRTRPSRRGAPRKTAATAGGGGTWANSSHHAPFPGPAASLAFQRKLDPAAAPVTTALGVLGMPGLTAYAGLLEIGRPKAGETSRQRQAPDRQDQGMPRGRHRGRTGQVPLRRGGVGR